MRTPLIRATFAASLALGLAACGNDPQLGPGDMLAVTNGATQNLIGFDRTSPGSIRTSVALSGLTAGDRVVGIDLRPVDGVLWALARGGGTARLYTVNADTGAATQVCVLGTTPAAADLAMDFNPVPNALRIAGSDGQNLRITAANLAGAGGACAVNTDTVLNSTVGGVNTTPRVGISAGGYTNSVSTNGATGNTALFYIDSTADRLTFASDPNGGLLGNIGGTLGVDIGPVNGFDIAGTANVATLAAVVAGATTSSIFSVDLVTGAATLMGTVGVADAIVGLTSRTRP